MNEFKKNSLIMLSLTTFASAVNYFCQITMGRIMSVSSFGIMNSLFSIIVVLSVPGTSLNMLTAKQVAAAGENRSQILSIVVDMQKLCFQLLGGMFLLFVIASPLCASVLKTDILLIFLTGVAVLSSYLPYVFSGIFSGLRSFVTVGFLSLIPPLLKAVGIFIAAVLPFADSFKMDAIMVMISAGNFLALLAYGILCRKRALVFRRSAASRQSFHCFNSTALYVMLSNFGYLVLINADIMLINICLGAESAGIYSAVMMFGRIIYYFTTALVAVLLPYVSLAQSRGENPKKVFTQSLWVTFVVSCLCMIPINLFPSLFVRLLYGTQYLSAVVYMPLSCAVAVLFSMINLELNY